MHCRSRLVGTRRTRLLEKALPLLPRTIEIVEALCNSWTAAELWKRSSFASRKPLGDVEERFKNRAKNYYYLEASHQGKAAAVGSDQISLRPETFDAAKELAQGHDVDWLAGKFAEWNKRRGVAPSKRDAAFLAGCRRFSRVDASEANEERQLDRNMSRQNAVELSRRMTA